MSWWWSWLLSITGAASFYLAGRKLWWAWWVSVAMQGLWLAYAVATRQYGFLVGVFLYGGVYLKNALSWTAEHFAPTRNEQDA